MNHGDHNFTEMTQQTKLRVEPVELDCRASRAVLFDNVDTAKMHGLDTSNVSSRVESCRLSQVEIGLIPKFLSSRQSPIRTPPH